MNKLGSQIKRPSGTVVSTMKDDERSRMLFWSPVARPCLFLDYWLTAPQPSNMHAAVNQANKKGEKVID